MNQSKMSNQNNASGNTNKYDDSIWLTSALTLRKVIGILGMAMPLLLFIFLWATSGYSKPLDSISHYYFTRASGVFIATLSILALFLMIYKGKATLDFILSTIAGIAALLVVLFPTGNISDICCDMSKTYSVTKIENSGFREGFHYVAAAVFICSLAFLSIFIFTKSNKTIATRGIKKIIRNRIYRICGAIMLLAVLVIFVGGYLQVTNIDFYNTNHLTFWMETIAIEAFGFAWLIKGEALFKDDVSKKAIKNASQA